VWIACLGVFLFWLIPSVALYKDGLANPSSTVYTVAVDDVEVPRVLVCNWNQDTTPDLSCSYCSISILSCHNSIDGTDCVNEWIHTPKPTEQGLFDCYTYNDQPDDRTIARSIGYNGSIQTLWSVPPPPITAGREGAQVSFLNNDGSEISEQMIFSETRFAPFRWDTFYSIRSVEVYRHEEGKRESREYSYETNDSPVNLVVNTSNPLARSTHYIGISFGLQSLNKKVIEYSTSFTLENFFGDFAGILGALMGVSVIKLFSSFPKFWYSIKWRTLVPTEDHWK